MQTIRLDGQSLTRDRLVAVAAGAAVELDPRALDAVRRAADFLAEQVRRQEPIYGVSTGFGAGKNSIGRKGIRVVPSSLVWLLSLNLRYGTPVSRFGVGRL